MQRLFHDIDKVAPTKASVPHHRRERHRQGAHRRAIHRLSPRKDAPFVKVNCAAIPRELIESELFGHERARSPARRRSKRGFFEQAHGGTLFLDEIGDMDLDGAGQGAARAAERRDRRASGREHVINVDVRVLAATNKDLGEGRRSGHVPRRSLLPARRLPDPRARRCASAVEDIALLAEAFMSSVLHARTACARSASIRRVFEALARAQVAGQRARAEERRRARGDPLERRRSPSPTCPRIRTRARSTTSRSRSRATSAATRSRAAPPTPPLPQAAPAPDAARVPRARRAPVHRRHAEASSTGTSRARPSSLGVERTNLHKKIRAYGIKRGEG